MYIKYNYTFPCSNNTLIKLIKKKNKNHPNLRILNQKFLKKTKEIK